VCAIFYRNFFALTGKQETHRFNGITELQDKKKNHNHTPSVRGKTPKDIQNALRKQCMIAKAQKDARSHG